MDPVKKRTPVIGGNWKMHKDPAGTTSFFDRFLPLVERSVKCEIVICPSFLEVENAVTAARGTRIQIGAQNLYWAKEGAFTGEVSGPMIKASGCSHVIVGHSERRVRRQLFLWVGDNYFSRPTTTTLYRSGAKPRGRLGFTA